MARPQRNSSSSTPRPLPHPVHLSKDEAEMIAAGRGVRQVPNPIHLLSEDEADVLVSHRRRREKTITLDEYLKKHGTTLDSIARRPRRKRV